MTESPQNSIFLTFFQVLMHSPVFPLLIYPACSGFRLQLEHPRVRELIQAWNIFVGEKLECAISLGMICDISSAWMCLEGMDQRMKDSGYCRKRIQIPVSPLIG